MKMQIVVAAALAAMMSHAAFAANEGGDTWSELQPQPQAGSIQTPTAAASQASSAVQRGFPMTASEGGDTWSELQSNLFTSPTPAHALAVATTASLNTLRDAGDGTYGEPAQVSSADRTVRLESGTQSINIENGDSVAFIAQDDKGAERSFAWHFDVSPVLDHVDLSQVAPADFPQQNLRVFVAPDPHYTGE